MVAALFLALLGLLALPAGAVTGPAEWPQFRAGPTHPGSDVPSVITPANVSRLAPFWNAEVAGTALSPVAVGDVVYIGSADQKLHAFPAGAECAVPRLPNVPSCRALWTALTGGAIESSPAVAGGVIYVGSLDHSLYAFDAAGVQGCSGLPKTCDPLWTAGTGDAISSSPAVAGGRVYVGSDDDKLYAFDAAGTTGCGGTPKVCEPLWTATTGGDVFSSPAVSGGVVYVGSGDGKVYAFDAAGVTNCAGTPTTCEPLWTATTGGAVLSSPSVVDGVVHVGSQDGKLYAFDAAGATSCSGTPKTCAPLWTAATGGLIISSPAVAGGVVYVGSFDKKLHAFDAAGVTNCAGTPKACTPLWTAAIETLDGVISSPSVANGLVFVGGGLGTDNLYAFDAAGVTNCSGTPKTCAPAWTGETGSSIRSSPAVAGSNVYVGADGRGLLAFSLPDARDGEYHPLVPSRILDTRQSVPLGENGRVTLPVAGRAGVPATRVSSVVLIVTATQPTAASHLAVFPSTQLTPGTSSVNFAPNQTVANAVVVKLSADGKVDIFNQQGSTHVVVDVQGWFGAAGAAAGARYNPLVPGRILDTRTTVALAPNFAAGLVVTGRNGVPATGVSSVVLNLTATQPTADGHLAVWPAGSTRPVASNINFAPNQTVANAVVAKVGTGGMVSIYNAQGSTHVVVDVQGWFED